MRFIALILTLSLLTACSNDESDNAETASASVAAALAPTTAPIQCEIDSNSIAGIPLGITLAQVRQQFPNAVLTPLQDAEGIQFTSIKITPEIEIFAYTDGNQANHDDSPITYMDTASRVCKTAAGVHPFMELAQAEKIYGAVQQIVMSEIESRQTAEFDQQPPELSFRIDDSGAFDATDTELPKITTDYQEGAKIQSIEVISLPNAERASGAQ